MFSSYYVYLKFFVISCFGFEGRIWVLTVASPGHCLLFIFTYYSSWSLEGAILKFEAKMLLIDPSFLISYQARNSCYLSRNSSLGP